ncbi:MAG: site-specific integrase [Chlorobium sp.]|nr:site-specific integrase [Chlorobium sp.]
MAKINLTPGRIASLSCESGQGFLWDSTVGGLGVRATPGGKRAYVIQSRFAGKAIRITIGDASAVTLESARTEARRLLLLIEQGLDPREQKRQVIAEQEEARAARGRQDSEESVRAMMVAEVWNEYLTERKPHWSERHYRDHVNLSQAGGKATKRGKGISRPGPLAPLMHLTLAELTTEKIDLWLGKEAPSRMTQTRLALRLLKAFLNWCSGHDVYKMVADAAIITRRVTATLPKKIAKTDCLQREQLSGWFDAVRQVKNPVIAAYLQALLLTGARREEVAGLRWEDIDFRWKAVTIRDKVEGLRVIPLTPYVEQMLNWLPRRNQWVFSSPAAASGCIQEPRIAHKQALTVAGIEDLTIHGLRRSFGSLSEWCELPVGIVAQIMGHKPSATAEKHYRVRPLDLLRKWHTKLEEWILEQAGIVIPAGQEEQELLRLVAVK